MYIIFLRLSVRGFETLTFLQKAEIILSKIVTNVPAVIPSAYQDGDFNSVVGPISGRFYTGGATTATSVSASGYYATHDVVVGVKSGSQSDFMYKDGSDSATKFYLYYSGLLSGIKALRDTDKSFQV